MGRPDNPGGSVRLARASPKSSTATCQQTRTQKSQRTRGRIIRQSIGMLASRLPSVLPLCSSRLRSDNRARVSMMPTRAASVERPAFQISATSSSMSGYLAREMAELPSSSFESGTGQTKFRFDATIIRRGALQPRAAPRLWGKRTRSLSPLTGGFSCASPGAR